MLIKTIDFPQEVLRAQRDGTLVVFAGAGVSMPPPSSLPHFGGLARQIGQGASPMQVGETEDQYLGRLHNDGRGIQVHELAARILLKPDSKPTELHSLLLQLFRRGPVRLVTTNFDPHFPTAARALGLDVPIHTAPALPLGDDFEGIVFLHGSAALAPRRIVLTDGDFGKAYLTYGWAARFLLHLFTTYTVLFVGYSHNDVVMRYLARGLPPDNRNRRFAFAARGQDAIWRTYGITPLHYDLRAWDNEHLAITESVGDRCPTQTVHPAIARGCARRASQRIRTGCDPLIAPGRTAMRSQSRRTREGLRHTLQKLEIEYDSSN